MIALFSLTLFAAGYNGAWKAQVEMQGGKSEILFTLVSDGDKLTGTMKSDMGEFPLQNGSVEGLDVFFTVNVNHDGNEVKATFRGHMFGNDEIQFKVEAGDNQFDMIAQKVS
jgi:hypothetical protein